jgi:hypothetical protein
LEALLGAWLTLSLAKLPVVVPVLVEVASGVELRWVGGPPGLFRGSHYFRLREVEGGGDDLGLDASGFDQRERLVEQTAAAIADHHSGQAFVAWAGRA